MDQMIKQQEDLNQQTTDQKDQKWNQFFQKTYWNKCTKLGESWKWNDEDIDQNTMDQMIKQREDFDQNQEVRTKDYKYKVNPYAPYILHTTGNALARVQRVHEPADLWDITFCTR